MKQSAAITRCPWCGDDPLYQAYHDGEWGIPCHDERHLFEMLNLEGAQAGLSWITILRKRENYREAFHQFDAERMARYGEKDISRLLGNAGIVRHRGKIEAFIGNARAYLALRESGGTLDRWLWQWVDGTPINNRPRSPEQVPANTPLSDRISRELRRMGFRFVGSTTCYAWLQASGVVNDHLTDCFCQTDRT